MTFTLSNGIKETSIALGFDLVGIASTGDPELADTVSRYESWLQQGRGAGMGYLSRHLPIKKAPDAFLPGARSIIAVGLLYGTAEQELANSPKISMYARGQDYHQVLEEKLALLANWLESQDSNTRSRIFVDKEPVLDRFWAQRAGLGWVGKNTCLINRKAGSLFFIGGLMTTAMLDADAPQTDHCGRCTKCLDACPTGALVAPRVLDANKCIGYHTIENKGVVPADIQDLSQTWIAGCDICQTVCPWNDPLTPQTHFGNVNEAHGKTFDELAEWDATRYKQSVRALALSRVKYGAFLRNLAIAIRNSELPLEKKHELLAKISARVSSLPDGEPKAGLVHVLSRQLEK